MAYPSTDCAHSKLWDTLSAWADRADDPEAWRERIVSLARKGPRDLAAYERGQDASLIRTNTGSKLFANADPPPPAEWLCVFDRYVRYGSVGRNLDGSSPPFDPLANYGLDDDPPRPASNPSLTQPPSGEDLLSSRSTDRHPDEIARLAGIGREYRGHMSPRMFHLARWIGNVAHQPVVPWWAARYMRLHPVLLDEIGRSMERDDKLPAAAKRTWQTLLEKFHTTANDIDIHWHEICRRIEAEGWSNILVREFDRKATPYIKTERPFGVASSRPPNKQWSELQLDDIARFEVAFAGHDTDRPEIRDDVLPRVYRIIRQHLELAAGQLQDIGTRFWKTETFYPEDKPGQTHITEASAYLLWFGGLFDRMVKLYPELAKADTTLWPKEEPFFFNKLRLYAWSFNDVFSGEDVANGLLSQSDIAFWDHQYRRELLHLLKRRWQGLPPNMRELLEQRLVAGRSRSEWESDEEYEQSRSITSATILGWLKLQGCKLGKETLGILPRLRDADPRWCPEWDEMADDSLSIRGGVVTIDTDPSPIIGAPTGQIIEQARKHTRRPIGELTEYKPFDGLVAVRPLRAVTALAHEARRGEFPLEFWRSAIDAWPVEVRNRLTCLFGARLARLPSDIFIELRHHVFHWLSNHFAKLAAQDQHHALSLLDALIDKLFTGGPTATKSGAGETYIGGERQDVSRRTLNYAINAPVGTATRLLLDLLRSHNPETASSIPKEIKSRIERLAGAPGEGADHAVCLLALDFMWLEQIDPTWTRATILPCFDLDHPLSEPAWNGHLNGAALLKPELFLQIKRHFLKLFAKTSFWNWDDLGVAELYQSLVKYCFLYKDDNGYVDFSEARVALQQIDDNGRANCISFLIRNIRNDSVSRRLCQRFLENAWPRESRFQTPQTTRQFVKLAEDAGDFFPEFVQTILPFIVPVEEYWSVYGLVRSTERRPRELPQKFPDATLSLIDKLVPESPLETPYELSAALEMIAEAKPGLRRDERWLRLKDITIDD